MSKLTEALAECGISCTHHQALVGLREVLIERAEKEIKKKAAALRAEKAKQYAKPQSTEDLIKSYVEREGKPQTTLTLLDRAEPGRKSKTKKPAIKINHVAV